MIQLKVPETLICSGFPELGVSQNDPPITPKACHNPLPDSRTLIRDNWVLSAAHCFYTAKAQAANYEAWGRELRANLKIEGSWRP